MSFSYQTILKDNKCLQAYPEGLTIPELFFSKAKVLKNRLFLSYWQNDKLCKLSWQEFSGLVNLYILILQKYKISKGDLVAIHAENSPEYLAIALATISLGAICCPIHFTLSNKQIIKLINTYQYSLLFTSHSNLNYPCKVLQLTINTKKTSELPTEIKLNSLSAKDPAYIMLSSGTTGNHKGIILTHKNILINQIQVNSILKMLNENDYYLSFLPFSHSYGGLAEIYQVIYQGASYHFCKGNDLQSVLEDFQYIQPTIFKTIPRMWEKLYKHFVSINNLNASVISQQTGGRIKFGFSAGARLDTSVVEFFQKYHLPIYQGYGLTEASPCLAISSPEDMIFYKRAKVLPLVDIKLSGHSEILAKGPNITSGYYKCPEGNTTAFEEGYLKTGDLGNIPEKGYLQVIERFKDLIILSTGTKVLPGKIEKKLNKHPLISHTVLIGTNQPYVTAILILDKEQCCLLVGENPNSKLSNKHILNNQVIIQDLEELISSQNTNFAEEEKIKKYYLTFEKPLAEELTPTNKIKRALFESNKQKIIENLYSN